MVKLLRRWFSPSSTIEFCETCARACGPRCRADTLLDNARTNATSLSYGRSG
jgi:hypothetical protein